MRFFRIEHTQLAYRIDFLLYGSAVLLLPAFVMMEGPGARWTELCAFAALGLGGWSALEYGLHRYVLHALEPFCGWHAEHHQRPAALICTPTLLSSVLILCLVFVPVWLLGDVWRACALTSGVLAGYLGYALTHHAIHHWKADSAWLRQRKLQHAQHHRQPPAHFGVTTGLWDRVFRSAGKKNRPGP